MIKSLVTAVCLLAATWVNADDLPDFPFVVAEGVAEIEVKPDMATIKFELLAFEAESEAALAKVNVASEQVLAAMAEFNIDTKQLEASDFSKHVAQQEDENYNNLNIIGYEVSRSMTIVLNDIDQYAAFSQSLIELEHLTRFRSSFDVSNREELIDNLLAEAAEKARKKAHAMAKAMGASIKSIYAVSQSSHFNNPMGRFTADHYEIVSVAGVRSQRNKTSLFIPETIALKQSINTMFRLKIN